MTAGATNLAAIRPDEWDLPLFVHVLGALALFGALTLTAVWLFSARRTGDAGTLRLGVRTLLLGVIPSWIVLRGSAEWISDKEGYADLDEPPDWIGLGYIATDLGLLLIIISGICAWLAVRRTRDGGSPGGVAQAAAILIALLVVVNAVAIWAMTTKPG